MEYQERNKEIIRTSVVGIAANVLLAGFKAVVGAIAGSVAIIMDAVNNLSDGNKVFSLSEGRSYPDGVHQYW